MELTSLFWSSREDCLSFIKMIKPENDEDCGAVEAENTAKLFSAIQSLRMFQDFKATLEPSIMEKHRFLFSGRADMLISNLSGASVVITVSDCHSYDVKKKLVLEMISFTVQGILQRGMSLSDPIFTTYGLLVSYQKPCSISMYQLCLSPANDNRREWHVKELCSVCNFHSF